MFMNNVQIVFLFVLNNLDSISRLIHSTKRFYHSRKWFQGVDWCALIQHAFHLGRGHIVLYIHSELKLWDIVSKK